MSARLRTTLAVALVVAASAALVAHMQVFRFVTDDAFISFVYARNLVEHGQLTFNLGERVEGYTNFLWTLFLAGFMKLGWRPESSSVVWGTIFAIGTMIVCALWSRALRREGRALSPWDALPALILAAVPGYACWSSGGLETQMFTFFVTLGGALYLAPDDGDRLRRGAAVAFALAALTRPEGNLFFALAVAHRALTLVRHGLRRPRSGEIVFVAIYVALVAPHFFWRHHYYGYWVPNTFYIKASAGAGAWGRGAHYLGRFITTFALWALALPAAAAMLIRAGEGTRRLIGYAALVVPVFCLYVAAVGGDFMGLYRFALPVVPLIALASSLGMRALATALTDGRKRAAWAPPAIVALLLGGYAWRDVAIDRASQIYLGPGASDNGIDTPGYLRWYTEDRAAIGKWFGRYAKDDDYAAVGGAGAQVYYSGMRSLDCYGLSDAYIAHEVAPVDTRPGHQKYAPTDYVLSRRPTVITSNRYAIAGAPVVREDAAFWRAHGYHYVSVEVPGLSSPWYTFLKRMDRALGPLPAMDDHP